MRPDERFAIFGAGKLGKRCYNVFKDKYDIICFCDNDPAKQRTKYLSLDVIKPDAIIELGCSVIVAVSDSIYALENDNHLDMIKQLYGMGVKEFYVPCEDSLIKIDLSQYDDIGEKQNKVCVVRQKSFPGAVSAGLTNDNPFPDLEVVAITPGKRDNDYYYNYLTSRLLITQLNESAAESKMCIEIWHGFPLKAIGDMCQMLASRQYWASGVKNIQKNKIALCSLSKMYSIFTGYSFGVEYERFRITGYPRNDMLFLADGNKMLQKLIGSIRQEYIFFYLPTFRDCAGWGTDGENIFICDMRGYNDDDFDRFLAEHSILFLYKLHSRQTGHSSFTETDNIKEITDEMLSTHGLDLYEVLNGTDCLISDYSSVIIDYLLTDKPMIFTPLDLAAYSKTRGLMMEPYDAWMPGEIAIEYEQLKQAMVNVICGDDIYKKDRERLRRITHTYTDAKSSERVLSLARDLMTGTAHFETERGI